MHPSRPPSSVRDGAAPGPAPAAVGAGGATPQARDAGHASYVFLLDDAGGIHPLPHALYVSLARAEAASEALAGKAFRLADWYVRLEDGAPERVVNEWYGRVRFDAQGRFEPAPGPAPAGGEAGSIDESALPTVEERQRMEAMLFSAAGSGERS